MSTFDLRAGGTGTQLPAASHGGHFILRANVSLPDHHAASTDVLQLFNIPAGTFVHGVGVSVTTAEGATLTIDLGDASDTDGYFAALSLNAVAKSFSGPGALTEGTPNIYVTAYAQGRWYAAAGIISAIVNTNGADTAVFDVAVICSKVFPK